MELGWRQRHIWSPSLVVALPHAATVALPTMQPCKSENEFAGSNH